MVGCWVACGSHTPSLHVGGWHAGMAFALGYIKAAAKAVGLPVDDGPPNPHIDPLLPTEAAVGLQPLGWAGHGSGAARVGDDSRPKL